MKEGTAPARIETLIAKLDSAEQLWILQMRGAIRSTIAGRRRQEERILALRRKLAELMAAHEVVYDRQEHTP
jgi:hypothetical protein